MAHASSISTNRTVDSDTDNISIYDEGGSTSVSDKGDANTNSLASKVYSASKNGLSLTVYALLCNADKPAMLSCLKSQFNFESDLENIRLTAFTIAVRLGHFKVVQLLINHFSADVNQKIDGIIRFDDVVEHNVSVLWLASANGYFDIVQILVENGADVNLSNSACYSPLHASSFIGRLDIVCYLVEKGAVIDLCRHNKSCLMIASNESHLHVVRYLLDKNSDPNLVTSNCETALHFAVEKVNLNIASSLVQYEAKMIKNKKGLTPLYLAADSGLIEFVEHFFEECRDITRLQKIESFELLGAFFANDKDSYNIGKAYSFFWLAMLERHASEQETLLKREMPPLGAYQYHKESQSISDIESMKDNIEAVHMEALIARERILGEDNPDIPAGIIFRGAVYADTGWFEKCLVLWERAMRLQIKNYLSVSKDLSRFTQVFSQMQLLGVPVEFEFIEKIHDYSLNEIKEHKMWITAAKQLHHQPVSTLKDMQETFNINLYTSVYLLSLMSRMQSKLLTQQLLRLRRRIYNFVKLDLRTLDSQQTPLHLVVNTATPVDSFYVSDVVHFPDSAMVSLLLECGAKVNSQDSSGNTPLHAIALYDRPISDFHNLHSTITLLLEAGAHVDMPNHFGDTPLDVTITGVADSLIVLQWNRTLKCAAARAVRKHNIPYKNQVPLTLEEFIEIH